MTDYLSQYSHALDIRDAREQAHKPYIDAYTRLADQTAASRNQAPPKSLPTHTTTTTTTAQDQPTNDILSSLRADLRTTNTARATLQTTLTTLQSQLTQLQSTAKTSTTEITSLRAQITTLERRLRDRDSELRGKDKLVQDAQDEMVALSLQLNLKEERCEVLERENGELVERWVRRMGEEVERVNAENERGERSERRG